MTRAAVVIVLLCVATLSTAHAQDDDKERLTQARAAFDAGKRLADAGDLDGAIAQWKQGYELKDDPLFLVEIARAYERKPNLERAVFFYKQYLSDQPHAANHAQIERHIAELQARIDNPASDVDVDVPGATPPPAPPVEPPSSHPGHGLKIAGIVIGGAGLAVGAVGLLYTLKSKSIQSDLEASTKAGAPWSAALSAKESSGRSDATLGAVGMTVGLVGLAGGITAYYLGARKDARAAAASDDSEARVEVLPTLSPNGGGVSLRLSY